VEAYEEGMQDHRREIGEMKMPSKIRYKFLKESGFSLQDIREATRRSDIGRNQRIRAQEDLAKFIRQMEDKEKKTLKDKLKNKGGKNSNYLIDTLIQNRSCLFPLFLISITLISTFILALWNLP